MAHVYSRHDKGETVAVELKGNQQTRGKVLWVSESNIGIEFEEPIDVLLLLAPPGEGPRPRLPRIEVECTAWVRQDGDVIRTRIVNISQGGICVQARSPLTIGADVVVTLPGLTPAAGVVKWADGGAYGIAFNRALILSELVAWLQEQQKQQRQRVAA